MKIIIAAPGRAGGAIALAAAAGGHDIVGLVSRSPLSTGLADRFPPFAYGASLPSADLLVIASRDDAITEVAEAVSRAAPEVGGVIHLSGFAPVSALESFAARGVQVGSFHPLQSLPSPEAGSRALAGSWVAITAQGEFRELLNAFATTMGMRPFDLSDQAKPAYHAAAAAASNYVVASLWVASQLLDAAGVPFEVARPLTETAVSNSFRLGPPEALTGPIVRRDWPTVAGQIEAASQVSVEVGRAFRAMAGATADISGTELPEKMQAT